jgi:hypothetical protein
MDLSKTDLTPLNGMQIQIIAFTPGEIKKGINVLRKNESFVMIFTEFDQNSGDVSIAGGEAISNSSGRGILRNGKSPEAFWLEYDRGDFKLQKASADSVVDYGKCYIWKGKANGPLFIDVPGS